MLLGAVLGGKLSNLAPVDFRGFPVIVTSLLLRSLSIFLDSRVMQSSAVSFMASLLPAAILLCGLCLNLRFPGVWLIVAGTCMNGAVIAANGGRMPVSLEQAAPERLAAEIGRLTNSITHQVLVSDTRLKFLADLFRWPSFLGRGTMFSLGDILITAGVFWFTFLLVRGKFPAPANDGTID